MTEDWFLNATGQSAAIPTNCSSSSSSTALQQLVCTAAAAGEVPALINNTSMSVDLSYGRSYTMYPTVVEVPPQWGVPGPNGRWLPLATIEQPAALPAWQQICCAPGQAPAEELRIFRGVSAAHLRLFSNFRQLQPRLIMQCARNRLWQNIKTSLVPQYLFWHIFTEDKVGIYFSLWNTCLIHLYPPQQYYIVEIQDFSLQLKHNRGPDL